MTPTRNDDVQSVPKNGPMKKPRPPREPGFWTSTENFKTGDVAELFGCVRQTVVHWTNKGILPSVQPGTHRYIPRAALIVLARQRGYGSVFEKLTGTTMMSPQDLHQPILDFLDQEKNRPGVTFETLRDGLEALPWTEKELNLALLDLRQTRRVYLFRPMKGRRKDNKKIHCIRAEHHPEELKALGWYAIPKV